MACDVKYANCGVSDITVNRKAMGLVLVKHKGPKVSSDFYRERLVPALIRVSRIQEVVSFQPVIFQCQTGRSRSSEGMMRGTRGLDDTSIDSLSSSLLIQHTLLPRE
jgi:hypothetical protein